ncbi:serine beta-lactamase-like protein LACTB, mitochondrial [Tigriopus californicus]|uniref:serine beta-lactamase-like protein LACTB, mitochondrial n=1 Tax=Tigriopus californicus TaxID=6832 RepID=UPI0027D9E7BB|nr:serine beta-lactamase-like protein LACTB, mitochondrial [Tigriopus californicus]
MYLSRGSNHAIGGTHILSTGFFALGLSFYTSRCLTMGLGRGHLRGASLKLKRIVGRRTRQTLLMEAKSNCNNLVRMKMNESGAPGLILGVAVDGKAVLKQGFGYADVEKHLLATPDTTMRIASISKSLTMAAVAKLVEKGKIDLDKPVIEYVPTWPHSHPTITTRQIVSHLAGIRHYIEEEQLQRLNVSYGQSCHKAEEFKEFHITERFESVEKSLELFKNDELLSKRGKIFHYSTHGFTLLTAIVEKASGERFERHIKRLFRDLGLQNTYLDEHEPLIPNRACQYVRNEKHILKNAPYVDNSCKWGSGGILSNVGDLLKFGNAMLYSYQYDNMPIIEEPQKERIPMREIKSCAEIIDRPIQKSSLIRSTKYTKQCQSGLNGFLKKETMEQIWNPVVRMDQESSLNDDDYAMGWMIKSRIQDFAFARRQELSIYHTGSAVGGRGVLLICPDEDGVVRGEQKNQICPQGVVVTILCNLENVSLTRLASQVVTEFKRLR